MSAAARLPRLARAGLLAALKRGSPPAGFRERYGIGPAEFKRLKGALRRLSAEPPQARDALIYAWLAQNELRRGRAPASTACLREAVRLDPRAAWRPFFGGLARKRPRPGELRKAIEAELARRPSCAWTYAALAELEAKGGRFPEALAAYDRALRLEPERPWNYALRARLKARFDAAGAREDFRKALSLDPGLGWAWTWSGELKRRLGKYKEALVEFNRGLKLMPSYVPAYAWRGSALLALGRVPEALRDLDRAVRGDPLYAFPRSERARARLELGDVPGALDDMTEAAALDPKHGWTPEPRVLDALGLELKRAPRNARAWAWKGETLMRLGRLEEALPSLSAAVEASKRWAWPLAWRGECLSRLGRAQVALKDLNAAVRIDPGWYPAFGYRARARLSLGRVRGASRDADRALRLNLKLARRVRACSQAAWLRALKGELLILEGAREAARAVLDEALALDPSDLQARRLRLSAGADHG